MGRLLTALLLLTGCAGWRPPELAVVPRVDLHRYMGVWYEVARLPNSFQAGCTDSRATYSLRADGSVDVVNECTRAGKAGRSRAVGRARAADATGAKLKVSFFWPFYGDYWIVELGQQQDYGYAVVSEPRRRYLWILARTPELPPQTLEAILGRLAGQGFPVEKLLFSRPAGSGPADR